MRNFFFIIFCMIATSVSVRKAYSQSIIGDMNSIPQGAAIMVDDFEKGNYWIWAAFDWEQWGPSKLSTSARLSNRWASQGKQSLECKMIESTADSDKDGMYYMDYKWNFTGAKYIVLDIYNPEKKSFDLGMAFQTTDNWNWRETGNITVTPGKHTIVLSLADFQDELYLVRRINICYRERTPIKGHFYIDNIRLIK